MWNVNIMVTKNDESEICNYLIFLNMYPTYTQGMSLAKVQEQKSCQVKHVAHLTYCNQCIAFNALLMMYWLWCIEFEELHLIHIIQSNAFKACIVCMHPYNSKQYIQSIALYALIHIIPSNAFNACIHIIPNNAFQAMHSQHCIPCVQSYHSK